MSTIQKTLGLPLVRALKKVYEQSCLARIPKNHSQLRVENLRELSRAVLPSIIGGGVDVGEGSASTLKKINELIPADTGGVNNGDRRAIYALLRYARPRKVLEIGTHVGASTAVIAEALHRNSLEGAPGDLVTLDIRDVNCESQKPWLKFNCKFSPKEVLRLLQIDSYVTFKKGSSIDFLSTTSESFDLIFLDGDHAATTVYAELPRAVNLLKPNGIILLHDYFPDCAPLWADGVVIPGPYLAVRRLQEEGIRIVSEPLGELPWPTKQGSVTTSLALVMR